MPVENLDYLKPGPDPEKLVNKKVTLKAHFLKRRSTFLFSEEFMHLQYSDIVFLLKITESLHFGIGTGIVFVNQLAQVALIDMIE